MHQFSLKIFQTLSANDNSGHWIKDFGSGKDLIFFFHIFWDRTDFCSTSSDWVRIIRFTISWKKVHKVRVSGQIRKRVAQLPNIFSSESFTIKGTKLVLFIWNDFLNILWSRKYFCFFQWFVCIIKIEQLHILTCEKTSKV